MVETNINTGKKSTKEEIVEDSKLIRVESNKQDADDAGNEDEAITARTL